MRVTKVCLPLRKWPVGEPRTTARPAGQLDRYPVPLPDQSRELVKALRVALRVPYERCRPTRPDEAQRSDDEAVRPRVSVGKTRARLR